MARIRDIFVQSVNSSGRAVIEAVIMATCVLHLRYLIGVNEKVAQLFGQCPVSAKSWDVDLHNSLRVAPYKFINPKIEY